MELCKGSLRDEMDVVWKGNLRYPERHVASILYKLGQALAHLQAQKPPIMHRDVKPENILISIGPSATFPPPPLHSRADEEPKLTDFGVAKYFDPLETNHSDKGTKNYQAPECPTHTSIQSDIYSLGLCAYEMMTMRNYKYAREHHRRTPRYSDELWQLVEQMLSEEPQHRPAALEVMMQVTPIIHAAFVQLVDQYNATEKRIAQLQTTLKNAALDLKTFAHSGLKYEAFQHFSELLPGSLREKARTRHVRAYEPGSESDPDS